jgi:penicillin amidase
MKEAWALWAREVVNNAGLVDGKGSNNWVLSGQRTVSGKPLLANDPHLDLGAPAIWYFASLQAPAGQRADGSAQPGLKVMGATLPGLPFVVLGRTDRVAWGFTNTGPDVQDLYIERIHPDDPDLYLTPKGWEKWQTRQETIKVKGQADVNYTARHSRHGPVISDAVPSHAQVLDLKRHVLALRWSALEDDNQTVLAGLLGNEAQSVDDLLQAFAHHHSPMQNVVMADVQGRIAYKAIGRAPQRKPENDLHGVAPAPGWMEKYDWQGWRSYASNPQDGGERGWIATANQRVVPAGTPNPLTQDWALPYRYQRIEQQLGAKERHDLDSMQRLQNDVTSLAMQKLLPHLLNTSSKHALAPAAMAELQKFDGTMSADRAAPLIAAVWADELVRGVIAPRIGEARFKVVYGKRNFRAGLEGMLASNNLWWCGDAGCPAAATQALDRALDRIVALQGRDVSKWQWGKAHLARSKHQPFGEVAALAPLFNVLRPTGGDTYTVNAGQYNPGDAKAPFVNHQAPSMRAVYDLSDLEQSVFIYQTGQSGLVFSSRYRDMADEWASGRYRPLQFKPAKWAHELTLRP